MQTIFGRTTIINSTNQAKTNNAKLKSKIRFGKIIAFGIAAKIIIGGAFSLINCLLVTLYKIRKLNSVNANADQT